MVLFKNYAGKLKKWQNGGIVVFLVRILQYRQIATFL